MNLTLEIPDEFARPMCAAGADLSRRALEALALGEYKAARISKAQLRRLLGFGTRYELDGFLKAHDVWVDATIEDVRRDIADLTAFLNRREQDHDPPNVRC
jgi:hypothetical protein